MSHSVKVTNLVRWLSAVQLVHQRTGRETRIVPLGFVIALVLSGAVVW